MDQVASASLHFSIDSVDCVAHELDLLKQVAVLLSELLFPFLVLVDNLWRDLVFIQIWRTGGLPTEILDPVNFAL